MEDGLVQKCKERMLEKLTSSILAISVAHHTFALEGATSSLVGRAYPLDADVLVFLQHIMRTRSTRTIDFGSSEVPVIYTIHYNEEILEV